MLTKTQRSLLVLLNSFLGAIIAPLNLVGAMVLMRMFYIGTPRFVPPNLTGAASHLFSKQSLIFVVLPCFLSTFVLAPILILLLEKEARKPLSQAIKKSALYGIGFGIVATFVTCVIALLLQGLKEPASSMAMFILKLFGLALFGVFGAVAFVFWCFPFILVSGPLFAIFNLLLVRFLDRR